VAVDRVIDLTESEILAENLRALGVGADALAPSLEDRVFNEYAEAMREVGGFVSCGLVAGRLGVNANTVVEVCSRLHRKGRMLKAMNPKTSKPTYVPRVAP